MFGPGDAMRFALAVVPEPGAERHVLDPGDYEMTLAVQPRNADPRFWEATLSLDPRWPGDDPWEHVRVATRGPVTPFKPSEDA
jgi:hypothetical protein